MIVTSSQDAIKRVVEAFERSDWSEIDVRSGTVRVHLSTTPPHSTVSPTPVADRSAPVTDTVGDDRGAADPDPPAAAPAPPTAEAHVVVSPSPGILWRSPEPGRPPFADLGHTVDASTTVCIIEVMKLMSHVKAGISGEIVAVYGQDGVAVQKGQPLFAIAPSGSAT